MPVLTPATPVDAEPVPTSESLHYVPRHSMQGRTTESGLSVVLWSRWGLRRLYVNTADGDQVGWVDLDTGNRVLAVPELETTFDAALRETAGISSASEYAPRRGLADVPDVALAGLVVDNRAGRYLEERIAPVRDSGEEPGYAGPTFAGRRAYVGAPWESDADADRIIARRAF